MAGRVRCIVVKGVSNDSAGTTCMFKAPKLVTVQTIPVRNEDGAEFTEVEEDEEDDEDVVV